MSRAFVGSLVGAGVGFLAGCLGVNIASGGTVASDTAALTLFVGCFLAGTGAIAGAVIGGVADLREFCAKKDRASDREALK
jgi:hypothetical protein